MGCPPCLGLREHLVGQLVLLGAPRRERWLPLEVLALSKHRGYQPQLRVAGQLVLLSSPRWERWPQLEALVLSRHRGCQPQQ